MKKKGNQPTEKKSASPHSCAVHGSTPTDQITRILKEERQIARAQMADELRNKFSSDALIPRRILFREIDRLESME